MTATTLLQRKSISVSDFRCTAGPGDKPFAEQHRRHSISYVRKGSFGLHCRGKFSELVAGSVLIGHPGDEYICTHEHVCGDECLSFFLAPELVEAIGDSAGTLADRRPRRRCPNWWCWANWRRRQQMAAATSVSTRSARCWRAALSRWFPASHANPAPMPRATAAARWRPRCGSMPTRIARSIWRMPPRRPASARSISCGCSRTCSASPRTNIWCARGCAMPRGGWPTTTARSPISPMMSASRDLSNFVRTFHRAAGASPLKFRQASRGDAQDFPRTARPPLS